MALDTDVVVSGRWIELERPWPSMARRGLASWARMALAESSRRDPAGGSQAQAGVPVPASLACSILLYEQARSQLGFPHSSLPKPHWLLGSAFFPRWVAGNAHLCIPGAPQ